MSTKKSFRFGWMLEVWIRFLYSSPSWICIWSAAAQVRLWGVAESRALGQCSRGGVASQKICSLWLLNFFIFFFFHPPLGVFWVQKAKQLSENCWGVRGPGRPVPRARTLNCTPAAALRLRQLSLLPTPCPGPAVEKRHKPLRSWRIIISLSSW